MRNIEFYPTSFEANIASADIECYIPALMEPGCLWYKSTDFDIHIGDAYCEKDFMQATEMPLSSGFVLYRNILDAAGMTYRLNCMKSNPFPYVMVKCVIPCKSRFYEGTERGGKLFNALCAERIKIVAWKKVGGKEWIETVDGDDKEKYNNYFNIVTE